MLGEKAVNSTDSEIDVVPTSVFSISCSGQDFKEKSSNVTCVLNKAAIPSTCSIASSVVEIQFCSTSRVGMIYVTYRCDDVSSCPDAKDDHDYYIADDIDDLEKASEKNEKERNKLLTILIPLITGTTMLMLGAIAVWKQSNRSGSGVQGAQVVTVSYGTTSDTIYHLLSFDFMGQNAVSSLTPLEVLPTPGTEMQSAPSQASPQI
ncbi:hypothetical protein C0Q70_18342 [Pomacea canaliculata]|uniref:Uncharacterized protein n=1 Tax=Pomacea canaliculata TaxID=400727 RepID=A0A2T7NMY7_POMCA|nr:hypothetical protein C0Q70_18342 [Pomacea canaliculata]